MEVAGEPVTGASERRLSALRHRRIGFVFQFFHLLPELTGEENVLLAGRVRGADAGRRRPRPRARRPPRAAPRRRLAAAPALRRRAAALRDRPRAGQRPGAACWPTSRRATSTRRRARTCCGSCAGSPRTAARSCSSRTRRRPPGSPTACCGCEDGRLVAMTRGRRRLLAGAGVLAASLVVGTGATVGYGLATGFDRAAERADLPDVVARFDAESRAEIDARVRALPNLAARSYRREITQVPLAAHGRAHAAAGSRTSCSAGGAATRSPRATTCGRGEVVVERGLARAWDLRPGRPARDRRRAAADRRHRARARQRRLPAHGDAARVPATRTPCRRASASRTSRCCGSPTPRAPTSR